MIKVDRGNTQIRVELEGQLGDLILESISVVETIREQSVDHIENSDEALFHYSHNLIDAVWDK